MGQPTKRRNEMNVEQFVEDGVIPYAVLEGKTTGEQSLILALCLEEMGEDVGIICAYYENIATVSDIDLKELIDEAAECFEGKYDSYTDFAEQLVDSIGYLDNVPENIRYYFDYEKFGRDLLHDYWEQNGYYFRNI